MADILKFPIGSIITFTTGAYSDFGICGYLVAIINLDLPTLAAQCRADFVSEYEGDEQLPENFPSWLVAKGYAMPVAANEIHLGSYGDWREELKTNG